MNAVGQQVLKFWQVQKNLLRHSRVVAGFSTLALVATFLTNLININAISPTNAFSPKTNALERRKTNQGAAPS